MKPAETIPFISLFIKCAELLQGQLNIELDQWSNRKKVRRLYNHINNIRLVKTIWDPNKPIDLAKFYCPQHIKLTEPNSPRTPIQSISDIPEAQNVVIQGIAGQGKSILIRQLCSSELSKGVRIPIFIELRRITASSGLPKRIEETFTDYDLVYNDSAFASLASSGKLCLLLDGFDEIDEELKASVVWDLETYAKRFPKLQIVVTARPDSGVCQSAAFRVIELCELCNDEYKSVIRKLLGETELAKDLEVAVESHQRDVRRLLTTPLMVTLLVLTYRRFERIPEGLAEFYDSIFLTLVWQHDKLKPGYKRPRKSGLPDQLLRRAFEAFAFYSKHARKASWTEDQAIEVAARAISRIDREDRSLTPDRFLDDLVRITCLIVRDGVEYRYIHRSIQEYFAASYIRSRPNEAVKIWYSAIVDISHSRHFQGELGFLAEIDRYRFIEFYALRSAVVLWGVNSVSELKVLDKAQQAAPFISLMNSVRVVCQSKSHINPRKGFGFRFTASIPGIGYFFWKIQSYLVQRFASAILSDDGDVPEIAAEHLEFHDDRVEIRPEILVQYGLLNVPILQISENAASRFYSQTLSMIKELEAANSERLDEIVDSL